MCGLPDAKRTDRGGPACRGGSTGGSCRAAQRPAPQLTPARRPCEPHGDLSHHRVREAPMPKMTPSEAFVETLVAHGVKARVRHRRLGLHGRARPLPDRRHPLHPDRARAGRGPHGRRLCARLGPSRRLHRPERPWHHQLRHLDGGRLLGALAGRRDHAGDRARWAWGSAASRRPSSCRSSPRSPSTRAM